MQTIFSFFLFPYTVYGYGDRFPITASSPIFVSFPFTCTVKNIPTHIYCKCWSVKNSTKTFIPPPPFKLNLLHKTGNCDFRWEFSLDVGCTVCSYHLNILRMWLQLEVLRLTFFFSQSVILTFFSQSLFQFFALETEFLRSSDSYEK
jgi:hypothetical protein